MVMTTIFVIGPAGSGKTTLVKEFGSYLDEQAFRVAYINLDCAVDYLPYTPHFDIRSYFTIHDIMKKFNLGPNGALVKSMELLLQLIDEVKQKIEEFEQEYDYVLVDTPGQLELVLFHEAMIKIIESFRGRSLTIFLIPADILRNVRDVVFLNLLALACRVRLNIPIVVTISKSDLLKSEVESILSSGLGSIKVTDEYESIISGIERDLTLELISAIQKFEKRQRLIKISSVTREGFDDLHTIIHEVFCTCGELS